MFNQIKISIIAYIYTVLFIIITHVLRTNYFRIISLIKLKKMEKSNNEFKTQYSKSFLVRTLSDIIAISGKILYIVKSL